MNKTSFYIYIPVSFSILIPLPGRFAYGIIMVFLLYLLTGFAILFKWLSSRFFSKDFIGMIVSIVLVSICILVRQFVIMFFPLLAFIIGIYFFMPAFASFILSDIYSPQNKSISQELKDSLSRCTFFSVFALVFFMIRDVLGYGTLSFPFYDGIFEIQILNSGNPFLASIPGAIVLLFLFILVFSRIEKNFEVTENIGEE